MTLIGGGALVVVGAVYLAALLAPMVLQRPWATEDLGSGGGDREGQLKPALAGCI